MSRYPNEHSQRACLESAYRALKACRKEMPAPRRDDLDQCPATLQTTLRRLALLMDVVKLEGRQVLLLGDDDLLSVAISASQLSTHVTVLDIDQLLLSCIAHSTKHETVEVFHHDLRQGLPVKMTAHYDVVFTDPPYTHAGQLVFLRSAMMALRNTGTSSLFLCASRLYLEAHQIQKIISLAEHAGLRLLKIEEDFNKYKAPPNVIDDLHRRAPSKTSSYFYSSLLHFVPGGYMYDPESLPFLPADIYRYDMFGINEIEQSSH